MSIELTDEEPDYYRSAGGSLWINLRKHKPTPEGTPGVYDPTSSATPLWLMSEEDVAARVSSALAPIEALVNDAEERRLACADDPDCPCAYKDCYECGKWHNCVHTPWAAIRAALSSHQDPTNQPAEGEA
jgi:hypothetical protein